MFVDELPVVIKNFGELRILRCVCFQYEMKMHIEHFNFYVASELRHPILHGVAVRHQFVTEQS